MRFCTKVICAVIALTVFGISQANAVEPLIGFGVIDLTKHEGKDKGHTIKEHVNKSDQELKTRVEDRAEIKNQKEIDAWEAKCNEKQKDISKARKNTKKAKLFGGLVDTKPDTSSCSVKPKPECRKTPMTSFDSLNYANDMINTLVNHPTKGISTCPKGFKKCELTISVTASSHNSSGYVRDDKCNIVQIPKSKLTSITAVIKPVSKDNPEYWYVLTMYPSY
jgi:hypothetical protein